MWSLIDAESTRVINDFNRGVFAHQVDYVGEFIDGYRFIQSKLLESMDVSELNPNPEPVVVVTHHLPTRKLIHPKFYDFSGNSAFYSNVLDSLKITPNCLLWFCGHTHEFGITNLPNGKCIANPIGYPGERRISVVQNTVYTIDVTTKKLIT
jgi:Icc-related predicted phosphoesterase